MRPRRYRMVASLSLRRDDTPIFRSSMEKPPYSPPGEATSNLESKTDTRMLPLRP